MLFPFVNLMEIRRLASHYNIMFRNEAGAIIRAGHARYSADLYHSKGYGKGGQVTRYELKALSRL